MWKVKYSAVCLMLCAGTVSKSCFHKCLESNFIYFGTNTLADIDIIFGPLLITILVL